MRKWGKCVGGVCLEESGSRSNWMEEDMKNSSSGLVEIRSNKQIGKSKNNYTYEVKYNKEIECREEQSKCPK